jgi:hypothetical protein
MACPKIWPTSFAVYIRNGSDDSGRIVGKPEVIVGLDLPTRCYPAECAIQNCLTPGRLLQIFALDRTSA